MKINAGGGLDSENEEIEVLEIAVSKAFKLLEENAIRDAKTVILLQYLQLNIPI